MIATRNITARRNAGTKILENQVQGEIMTEKEFIKSYRLAHKDNLISSDKELLGQLFDSRTGSPIMIEVPDDWHNRVRIER